MPGRPDERRPATTRFAEVLIQFAARTHANAPSTIGPSRCDDPSSPFWFGFVCWHSDSGVRLCARVSCSVRMFTAAHAWSWAARRPVSASAAPPPSSATRRMKAIRAGRTPARTPRSVLKAPGLRSPHEWTFCPRSSLHFSRPRLRSTPISSGLGRTRD